MTNNNQDVLDEFDKEFADRQVDTAMAVEREVVFSRFAMYPELKAFISQKLTERTRQVIEAIPNEIYTPFSKEHRGFYDWIDTTTLKKNLTSRFLDQEVGEKE